jgi:hypothetical protein
VFIMNTITPESAETELAELAEVSLDDLKARWLELRACLCQSSCARTGDPAVAHAIQETAYGGLDPDTAKRLDQLVRQIVPKGTTAPRPARKRIKAGTRLLREWQGQVHEVTVAPDGAFLWRGAQHKSLSVIARQITGTRWNGWTFFGLKKTAAAALQARPARRPHLDKAESGTGHQRRAGNGACVIVPNSCAAPSTPANRARKAWSRISTPSMPSVKHARPTWPRSAMRAGRF